MILCKCFSTILTQRVCMVWVLVKNTLRLRVGSRAEPPLPPLPPNIGAGVIPNIEVGGPGGQFSEILVFFGDPEIVVFIVTK